jgi:ubiquinol-cytochrome c reductase cytochrome b subunit
MLMLAIVEGFAGYSLPDDLLSGMGLAIAYSVALSLPLIGGQLATLLFDGRYPGGEDFWPRLFIAHVFILPAILATLIAIHLAIVMRQHHAQFPGPGRKERNVVGTPLWPGYALRSLGWFAMVAGVITLLGGLVQINPIWEWGPYHVADATNGAQPDWYLGWLIGALRITPGFDLKIGDFTLVPNPFWGGVLLPLALMAFLVLWPWLERRITGDDALHNLLDRPRDNPMRTAVGAAVLTCLSGVFFAGAADRLNVSLGIPYAPQIWFWRFVAFVLPFAVFFFVRRFCEELRSESG